MTLARLNPARDTVVPGQQFADVGGIEERFPTIGGHRDHGDPRSRPWKSCEEELTVTTATSDWVPKSPPDTTHRSTWRVVYLRPSRSSGAQRAQPHRSEEGPCLATEPENGTSGTVAQARTHAYHTFIL